MIKINPHTQSVSKEDLTKEDIETWFHDNRLLIKIRHARRRDVIPEIGGFWMLGEYYAYNWKKHTCLLCLNEFNAHYTNQFLCHECFHPWEELFHKMADQASSLRFRANREKEKRDTDEILRLQKIRTVGIQTKLF